MTLFFAALQAVRPGYFLGDDNANYFLPLYDLVASSPGEGSGLAWWNPYQDSGQEVHSRAQPGVLYPPVYLAFGASRLIFGHAGAGIEILAWMHLVAAAWGMYGLARQLGAERGWAVLWGFLWCSQPFLVQLARCWIPLLYLAAWAPFILRFVWQLSGGGGARAVLALAVSRVVLVYSGHPHYFLLFSALEGVFALVSCCGMDRGKAKVFLVRYAGSWILSGLWAAPLLVPFYQALGESSRRAVSLPLEQVLAHSMSLEDWWFAQWGIWRPQVLFLWGSEVFWQGGVWVVATLGGVVWWFRRLRPTRPFLALLVCALLGFVGSTVFYVIFAWIPMLDRMRWPGRNFVLFGFYFMVLAIVVFSGWGRVGPRWRGVLWGITFVSLVLNIWINGWKARSHPWGGEIPDMAWMTEAAGRLPNRTDHRVMTVGMPDYRSPEWKYFCRNYATLVRVPHFMGYDILRTRDHEDFLFEVHHRGSLEQYPDEGQLGRLRQWGVRYYFVREALGAHPAFRELWREGGLCLVEDPSARSVARFRGAAVPVVWRTNGARVSLPAGVDGGWLEVAVWPAKGMELWADGKRLEEGWRFDGVNPPGVWVPAGTRVVELRVGCPGFRTGMVLAGAGMLLAGVYVVAVRRGRG